MSDFLNAITVASPCTADWNTMVGDDQVRFCQQCQLNVYNLSGMTPSAAETLVQNQEGRLCVRFYQRPDGTMLTQDCPVGVQALHRSRLQQTGKARWGKLAAAMTILTLAGTFQLSTSAQSAQTNHAAPSPVTGQQEPFSRPMMGKMMMGDVATPTPPTTPSVSPAGSQPDPQPGQTIQGNIAFPIQQSQPSAHPKKPCKPPSVKTQKIQDSQPEKPAKLHDLSELQPFPSMMGSIAPRRENSPNANPAPTEQPDNTPHPQQPTPPENPLAQ